jgi:hypothetical protein
MRRVHVKVKPGPMGIGLRLRPALGGEAYVKASTIFTGPRPRPVVREQEDDTVVQFERGQES